MAKRWPVATQCRNVLSSLLSEIQKPDLAMTASLGAPGGGGQSSAVGPQNYSEIDHTEHVPKRFKRTHNTNDKLNSHLDHHNSQHFQISHKAPGTMEENGATDFMANKYKYPEISRQYSRGLHEAGDRSRRVADIEGLSETPDVPCPLAHPVHLHLTDDAPFDGDQFFTSYLLIDWSNFEIDPLDVFGNSAWNNSFP